MSETDMKKTVNEKKTLSSCCTSFQLYKSQNATFDDYIHKIIDFTEKKLIKYISTIEDEQQKLVVSTMILDYKDGKIAISWRNGRPTWVKIVKDT